MIRNWMLILSFVLPGLALSQEEEQEPIIGNETMLGIGAAFPGEKDPLNVPGEIGVPTSFGINLGYRHYFEGEIALGLRLYGSFNKLTGYTTTNQAGVASARDFSIVGFNYALEGLKLFGKGAVRPYVLLLVAYANGSIHNDDIGTLQYNGIAGGGGLGLRCEVSSRVAIALEGLGSFGTADWKQKPAANASSTKFDPSMVMALAGVWIRW